MRQISHVKIIDTFPYDREKENSFEPTNAHEADHTTNVIQVNFGCSNPEASNNQSMSPDSVYQEAGKLAMLVETYAEVVRKGFAYRLNR